MSEATKRARERLDALGPDWPHRGRSDLRAVGGLEWHVQRFGEAGPRVLLLHGTGASTHSWRDLAPVLAERTRVMALDLPGHGASTMPGGDGMRLTGMARRLAELCHAEGFAPDVIVGHSAGAAVAIAATMTGGVSPRLIVGLNAALQPMQGYALFSPLAKGLFLNPFTPSLFARFGARERTVRGLLDGTGTTLDERGLDLYRRLFADPAHVRGALGMMASWDLEWLQRHLPELRARLVLVTTADDGTIPARDGPRHIARVRDGELVALPDGGHLVHEVRPKEIAALVLGRLGMMNGPAVAGLPERTKADISATL